MKEEIRVVQEYGTVCGFTGKWLVQCRFSPEDEWSIIYTANSQEEAQEYIDNMPDWAR